MCPGPSRLAPRDRSLVTVAVLAAAYRPDQLPTGHEVRVAERPGPVGSLYPYMTVTCDDTDR